MALGDMAEHIRNCREVYGQLCEIYEDQRYGPNSSFNRSILLAHFDRYIKWLDRNVNVVVIDQGKPRAWVGRNDDTA